MTQHHVTADIDLGRLSRNVETLKRKINGPALMAIVKANAYGHGLVQSAQAAKRGGADWLATALIEEAIDLRNAGVAGPILTWLNTLDDRFEECISKDIDLGINSLESLSAISVAAVKVGKPARVQVKIDTGLGRNGVTLDDLPNLISALKQAQSNGQINVIGVFSHFAYADEPSNPTIGEQINNFKIAVDALTDANFELEVKHLSNSAATLGLPHTYNNLVRPGLAIYGISPSPEVGEAVEHDLKPVMRLRAPIILIKDVPAGTGVSYAHQYHTKNQTKLALIPAGYADGIPRAASNKGPLLIDGKRFTISGRVCMDQFVVDIGDANVKPGDQAVLFGDAANGEPSVNDWAEAAGTINYEIVTRIGPRVFRNYLNG
ncbi:MAG: Alanine racemase [Actinomycetota bacterium]|jgi:alanine racemase